MKNKNYINALVCVVLNVSVFSQYEFYNNGDSVMIQNGALVKVQGTATNLGALTNNGLFDIDRNHEILSLGVSEGNGEYRVKQDWINSNVFIPDSSLVRLWGSNQLIGGSSITTFWNLSCENTGVKSLGLNANVLNTLDLNEVETYVETHKLTVFNPFPYAVRYDSSYLSEGFVSNIKGGELVWYTASDSSYIFPMGSSNGLNRFRRIVISPKQSNAVFNVGFQNYDANFDNLNRDNKALQIDKVNDKYYHTVYQSLGVSNEVSLSVNYDFTDGDIDGLVRYNPQWNFISEELKNGFDYPFVFRSNLLLDSNTREFALATKDKVLQIKQLVTPNGDYKNDTWIIVNIELYESNVKVFNRWGNLVFETNNYRNDWDGIANTGTNSLTGQSRLPSGTYYYIVEVNGQEPQSGYLQLHNN